jgi:SAM-dependent methyltransferase
LEVAVGIDIHNLNFLAVAHDLGVRFQSSLAIGRQAVHVEPRLLEAHRVRRGLPHLSQTQWFEPLLQEWHGAEHAHSVDASPYEGATHVHDMNQALPAADPLLDRYDAVLDFGCLEHVFDFATAWRNVVGAARVGGHVLHALPCNNLSGHGFYQFSPELFFNLYRPENGFELIGLWAALYTEPRYWWKVANPFEVRRRVNLRNGHEVYLLVLAKKVRQVGLQITPQQSDYSQGAWQQGQPDAPNTSELAHPAAKYLHAIGQLDRARRWRDRWQGLRGAALNLPSPDFERVDVARLTSRSL